MYNNCSKPTTSPCGTPLGWGVDYPFWVDEIRPDYCGLEGYKLSCQDNGLVLDLASDIKYNVLEINPFTFTIEAKLSDSPLHSICELSSSSNQDTKHNDPLFSSSEKSEVIYLFYNCSDPAQTTSIKEYFSCESDNRDPVYFFRNNSFAQAQKNLSSCNYTRIPVHMSLLEEFIMDPAQQKQEKLFEGSFEIYYNTENQEVCKGCYKNHDGVCWKDTYIGSEDPCLYQSVDIFSITNTWFIHCELDSQWICESSSNSNQDTKHNDPVFYSHENSEVIYVFYNCSDHAQTTLTKAYFSCQSDNRDPVYFFGNDLFAQAQKYFSSCNYTRLPVNKWLFEQFIMDPAQQTAEKLFEGSFEVYYKKEGNQQVCKDCNEHDDGVC
ncbi:hypothetical protein ACET3Z_014266 [Daucus carota]